MDSSSSSNQVSHLVFETLEELRLVVSYQTTTDPTDAEWDDWISAANAFRDKGTQFRLLAVTEGGHPNKSQVDRLRSAATGHEPLTAIVSPSASIRFVASLMLLFNRSIRCFSPAQFHRALAHLDLALADGAAIEAAIGRLRRRLGLPA
jgi:hypothetical protein